MISAEKDKQNNSIVYNVKAQLNASTQASGTIWSCMVGIQDGGAFEN